MPQDTPTPSRQRHHFIAMRNETLPDVGTVISARLPYVALALGSIAAGLAVHRGGTMLSPAVRDVTGDALWAMMIAWWAGAITPRAPLVARGAAALTICVMVELSQLYHTPTLDALRSTTLGALVLGSGFDVRDLAAYALGIAVAALGERWMRPERR